MTRRAFTVYLLLYVCEVAWLAMVPLAPRFAEELDLSGVQTGALLGGAGVATLVISLPVGVLTDRLGARRVTFATAIVLVVTCAALGLAPDYPTLLAARIAFGVALGGIWTAAVALLSTSVSGQGRTAALGGTITVAAAASVTGPALTGALGDAFSLGTPFLVLAALAVVPAVLLALDRDDSTSPPRPERHSLRMSLGLGRRETAMLAGLTLMVLVGVVNGTVNLLVPLELRGAGMSAGEIGVWFSVSSAAFFCGTIATTRLAGRRNPIVLAWLGAACYGGLLLVPLATGATAALLLFLLVRTPFWAAASTLAYPLGGLGASRAAIGHGAVIGMLNVAWGLSNTLGPVTAGAVADVAGTRAGYVPALLVCAAAAAFLAVLASRQARSEPVLEPS